VVAFCCFRAFHALRDDQKALVGLKCRLEFRRWTPKLSAWADRKTDTDGHRTEIHAGRVKVLTVGDMSEAPGYPALWVFVGTNIKQGLVSYSIRICLIELVTLARGFQTTGTIWNDSAGGVRTINASEIRKIVGDLVDEFINDYLAANPK
jgi:hypothetical protein